MECEALALSQGWASSNSSPEEAQTPQGSSGSARKGAAESSTAEGGAVCPSPPALAARGHASGCFWLEQPTLRLAALSPSWCFVCQALDCVCLGLGFCGGQVGGGVGNGRKS